VTPDVLRFGETITNADGTHWMCVDVAADWRDPASQMLVSVSGTVPVKLNKGQIPSELRAAAIDGFLSALRTIIGQNSADGENRR
jgi:hypothetical protein